MSSLVGGNVESITNTATCACLIACDVSNAAHRSMEVSVFRFGIFNILRIPAVSINRIHEVGSVGCSISIRIGSRVTPAIGPVKTRCESNN